MPRLTVIIANDYASPAGGASKIALLQARGLQARGHRVILFAAQALTDSPGVPGADQRDGLPSRITGQWDIAGDPRRSRAMLQGIWNWRAARMLGDLLEEVGRANTVLLLHSWSKALSSSIVRTAITHGVPVVAVLHDYFIGCPNGAYHHFHSGKPCTLRPMSPRCMMTPCDRQALAHKPWRVARQAVQQHLGCMPRGLAAVICVSDYQRAILHDWLPDELPCHVLPNPVAPAPEGLRARVGTSRRFLFVGRLSAEKGPLIFAAAAREAGVEAVFVGDGVQRADILRILPHAPITGWVDADRVWREMSDCRALIYPSMWHETFGLSVYEAASLGVPSVVSSGTAPAEFVVDGHNGLRFPQGDVEALARLLSALACDPDRAVRLGERARADSLLRSQSAGRYDAALEQFLYDALGIDAEATE